MPILKRTPDKKYHVQSDVCKDLPEDNKAMVNAANSIWNDIPPPSLNETIMYYEGDKYQLARDMAGTTGDPQVDKHNYQKALYNINRYLRGVRSPSSAVRQRMKELYTPSSERDLYVKAQGCICISNDCFPKVTPPIRIPASEVNDFLTMAREDNQAAWQTFNDTYFSDIRDTTITWKSNARVNMQWE